MRTRTVVSMLGASLIAGGCTTVPPSAGEQPPATVAALKPQQATAVLPTPLPEEPSVEAVVLGVLQNRSARIESIEILERRPIPSRSGMSLVVARGIRADGTFEGDFSEELYGLFVVRISPPTLEEIVDVFPTPRWNDYKLQIQSVDRNKVTVVGQGATYGDSRLKRTYWFVDLD